MACKLASNTDIFLYLANTLFQTCFKLEHSQKDKGIKIDDNVPTKKWWKNLSINQKQAIHF